MFPSQLTWLPKKRKYKKRIKKIRKPILKRKELSDVVYDRLNKEIPKKLIYDALSVINEYIWQQIILYKNDVSIHNFGTFALTKKILYKNTYILIKFLPSKRFRHVLKLRRMSYNI